MRLRRKSRLPAYRLFFATDVHGSDRCFRKFLAAASAYGADALVLGGDVAGKAMVPIVADGNDRYRFSFQGGHETVSAEQLADVEQRLRFNGFYPRISDELEMRRMTEDDGYVVDLFSRMIVDQLTGWCQLAAERLEDNVRCLITPGNDDPWIIDGVLERASKVECPERQTVRLGPVWLASLGNTNRTPWDTDREFDESTLTGQIDELVTPFADGRPLVFNFHCPPYGSGLDTALKLDESLKPVLDHGNPVEIPVGSTAVAEAMRRYAPIAGIHGHIHESRRATRIARTWCFNPGSDYASGILKGLILDFAENGDVQNHLFTNG